MITIFIDVVKATLALFGYTGVGDDIHGGGVCGCASLSSLDCVEAGPTVQQ